MNELSLRIITGIILFIIYGGTAYFLPVPFLSFLIALTLGIILIGEWPQLSEWLLTPIYPILPFTLMIILNQSTTYRPLLFFTILMTFAHDAGAYIGGKLIGKKLLLPSVSPKKTWEGFLCGMALSLSLSIATCSLFYITLAWYYFIPLIIVGNCIALCGDLFESHLKRAAHVKDSSNLLPGHGGFLDRCDSILFTIPYIYCLKTILM